MPSRPTPDSASPTPRHRTAAGLTAAALLVSGGAGAAASLFTDVRSASAATVSKPSAPSSLAAKASSTGVVLTWHAPSGTAPITYAIYRSTTSTRPSTPTVTGRTTLTWTDTAITPGVKYYYWVSASNSAGTSSFASTSATVPASTTGAPAAPAGLKLTPGAGSVALAWTRSTTSTLKGYDVYRTVGGTTTKLPLVSASASTLTDTGLAKGASVSYEVRALSSAGVESTGAKAGPVTVLGDTTPPRAPSSASASYVADKGVVVKWAKGTEADLAGYRVLKRNSAGTYVAYLGGGTSLFTGTTFEDDSVPEGTSAYYRIYAVDTSGNTSSYSAVTAPLPNKAPAVPSGLRATGGNGVTLTWTADTAIDLSGYSVYRSASSSGTYTLLTSLPASATAPRFVDTSAPQGVAQYYKVSAVDTHGNASAQSSAVSATSTVAPTPLPVHPTVLTVGPGAQFPTITAALATIPASNLQPYEIDIAPGTYRESFEIASPYVTLKGTGASPSAVVIADDKVAGATDPSDGQPYGTAGSATVFVSAHDVTLTGLTVANTWVEGSDPAITSQQAVALRVEGDRFVANGTRILGNQDTLLADTIKPTTRSRQYYVNSYIEGDVDYLFGAADAVFDNDVLHSLDRGKSDNGAITAASTDGGSSYGFLITNSRVISSAAPGTVHLGRPWHPNASTSANPSVVYANTWLPAAIATQQPWEDMTVSGTTFSWSSARLSEYKDVGPGAGVGANRPQLTDKAALKATPAVYLAGKDGWNPVVAPSTAAPAAPTGVTASSDSRTVTLSWADSDSAAVVGWDVYRSTAGGALTKVGTTDSPTFTDSGLVNGSTYAYAVTAVTRSGTESATSASVSVTVAPRPLTPSVTVAADGSGDYRTVAAALAAAPAGTATAPTVIGIEPGTYIEQLTVSKPYTDVIGLGGSPSDVVLEFDVAHGTVDPDTGQPYGTGGSAAVTVTANNTLMKDLTVANHWDPTAHPQITDTQAVALRTTGDKQVYDTVRVLGRQDTLEADTPSASSYARSYFVNSYVEGTVDFVFGRGSAVFDRSTLHGLNKTGGTVFAPDTSAQNPHGFLVYDSKITSDAPTGTFDLGRPWPNVTQASDPVNYSKAQTTIVGTFLGNGLATTKPWIDWNSTYTWDNGRWAEYGNTGPAAAVTSNRPQLSAADAATTDPAHWLASTPLVKDGWDPTADAITAAPAAVQGLTEVTGSKLVTLSWAESTDSRVQTYEVFRSSGGGARTLVATVSQPGYADHGVTNGTAYTYTVVGVLADGTTTPASAAVTATPAAQPLVPTATVAADGSGDYRTVGAALAALPAGTAARPTVIAITPGTYREVIAVTRPWTVLTSTTGKASDVVITYDNANGTPVSATTCPQVTTATTCGTYGSATATVSANDVTVQHLTIANGFVAAQHPEVGGYNTQAVALRATGDQGVYDDVRLLGVQDTLDADATGNISADGTGYPRQYYVDSFIQGNVDFVFGRATAAFERVTFSATNHGGGTIFAPSTAVHARGYLVRDSRIASDNDPGTFSLGRPWRAWGDGTQPDDSRGQTLLVNTWMAGGINAAHPWADFAPNVWSDGRWGEYGTTGPGAATSADRPTLSAAEAAADTVSAWLAGGDGWDPSLDAPSATAPAAPTGVTAAPADGQVSLSWAESPEADVVGYHVYRAQGTGPVPVDAAHRVDGATLTRTGFTDSGRTNGTAYSYVVTAVDSSGATSAASRVVSATPAQHIDAVVASDGSGDYTSLQAAVNAIADGHTGRTVLAVRPGTYTGAVTIPASKGSVTLLGASGSAADATLTNGTATPTLTIPGNQVTVQDLTITNTSGANNSPAVAMTGDQVVLLRDTISGTDRPVWADVPTAGALSRQLIEGSSISGTNNLVLGRATVAIDSSTLTVTRSSGFVLIPSTTATGGHGILVTRSTIAGAPGVVDVRLGGGYAQGTTTSANAPEAVVRDTQITAALKSQPWVDFNGYAWTSGRFAEYGNTGSGAAVTDLRPQLTPAASVGYTVDAWLGGGAWYPAVPDPATPADVTAPAAPTGLRATTGSHTAILTWTAPADGDLAGYRLYRSTTTPVALSYATLVRSGLTGTTFTDTGLVDGTPYTYALVAVDTAGNTSTVVTTTATSLDTTPPAAPAGVAAGAGDGRVTVTWAASPESDVAGYRVYAAGGSSPLTSGLVTGTSYTQTGLTDGTAYSYVVTAVDTAGNESAASAVVSATPAAGDSTAPAVPGSVSTALAARQTAPAASATVPATWAPAVKVSWAGVGDADLAGYSVYRSAAGGAPVKVSSGLVTGTSYTDTSVTAGTAYSYTVTASDTAGNESAVSSAATLSPTRVDVVVATDGSGDATSVGAGIGLLPDGADFTTQGGRTVLVLPGTYSGTVTVGNRYGVTLVGGSARATDTVLTAGGTGAVATVTLAGNAWTLRNLTVANTNGPGTGATAVQGTAVQIKSGDKDVLDNVRLTGDSQVFLPSTAGATTYSRVYVRNSWVEGGSDLVLGRAVTVFDHTTFHVLNRPGATIFDNSTGTGSAYGFLVTGSTVLTDGTGVYLSRPYGTNTSQVVVRGTALGAGITTAHPWKDWSATLTWDQARFAEYGNTGDGAAVVDPSTRPQLSDDATSPSWQGTYTAAKYLACGDGWAPQG